MANRTSVYKFLYSQFGDIWYPGFDYENMLTAETNFSGIYSFFGPGIINGWNVTKLEDERADQILLLDGYNQSSTSEYGQKLALLDLDFSINCKAATTTNITLSGEQTIDNISIVSGDIVLVKNQTIAANNGVYIASSSSWSRHSSLDLSSDYSNNFLVYVSSGSSNEKTLWLGAVLATNFTLGSSNLYFQNAFKQCIKVNSGNGIVDKYAAKTEKSHYFRQTVNNTFYVWAESGISTLSDEICNITCPSIPDDKYNTYSNAVYLATVNYVPDSSYSDINVVSEIILEERRNQINESAGEFQRQLQLSYLKHKHLGQVNTAEKIDLGRFLVLYGSTNDGSSSYSNSSIFLLKYSDGTNFTESLSSYGTPIIKLDGNTLLSSEYSIDETISPTRIYLLQGIKSTSRLEIFLPYSQDKSLIAVDDVGAIISTALTFNSQIRLSDETIYQYTDALGITTDRLKYFSWTEFSYDTAEVYLADNLLDPAHYTINPYSGTITLENTIPNYSLYTFTDLRVVIKNVKAEIKNNLSDSFIKNVSANSVTSGQISINSLRINHYSENKYKVPLSYVPSKYLSTGIGKSYLNPQNTNSAIQYNDNIQQIYKSSNIFSSLNLIYTATSRGLFTFNLNSNLGQNTSWQNDWGKIIQLQDNLLYPSNENYFKNLYALTNLGQVLYKDSSDSWNKLKLPKNESGIAKTLTSFKVSSDLTNDKIYQTYFYGISDNQIFYSIVPDNTAYQNWDWAEIDTFVNASGTAITTLYGMTSLEEVSSQRTTYVTNQIDDVTIDHVLYVGAIGSSTRGLYYGDYSLLTQIFDEPVKGIYWIKDGDYKNNLIWWNDYQAFITHTAKYNETSSGKYYDLPFSQSAGNFSNALCATTGNISLSGTQTIDGVSVSAGNVVLVKNQTTKSENGIYIASAGSWTRSTELDANSEFINYKKIYVTSGTYNSESYWYLSVDDSFALGTSDIDWNIYKLKIYQNSTPSGAGSSSVISCAIKRNSSVFTNEYFIGHSNGVARIQESSLGKSTAYTELFWEPQFQKSVNSLYSYDDGSNYGKLYAGTSNGLFLSSELLWQDVNVSSTLSYDYKWKRANDTFQENDTEFSVFDSSYNQITDFSLNYPYQMVSIGSSYVPGNQLYYENNFNSFTTDPWNDTLTDKTRLFVYINDKPSTIPFYSNPLEGKINFTQSVSKEDIDNLKLSIVNDFPTISNPGTSPHSSTFVPLYKTKNPIALLSRANTNTDTKIYLNQTIANYSLLEIKSANKYEIVPVKSIDNSSFPIEVTLSVARLTSSTVFDIGTEIYGIKNEIVSGLEDDLQIAISNQTYHLSSVNNSNVQELARSLKVNNSSIFNFSTPTVSQTDTRGLKNTLLVDNFLSNANFDSLNSSYKNRTELIPNVNDFESNPIDIKGILNLSKNGSNTRIITDKGVWKYDGYWQLEDKLDNAYDLNFISYDPGFDILVGASNGLWKYDGSWTKLAPDYKQNAYLNGSWNNNLFEAFATEKGLSIKVKTNDGFISDFLKLTSNNINGIFKGSYVKNASGTITEFDSIHAAGDDGYYVIGYNSQYSTFSNFMTARKMFADSSIDGVTKYYKSFQAYNVPSLTSNTSFANSLYILTNDGVIKVRNYKYSYPDDLNSTDFKVDKRFLRGLHCFSYAIDIDAGIGSTPGKSKIYIGTNDGVYRSFDGGNTFERSDYIGEIPVCVYDLQIFSSTFNSITQNVLVACTNNGIWYTLDDGDCWYRTGESTSEGYSPVLFQSQPSNDIRFISSDSGSVGYLAQTFTTSSTANTISKVSAYVTIREQDGLSNSSYNDSLANTTLTAYVYSVDSNSKPQTQLASSSPITSSSVNVGAFTNFNLSSALDIPGSGSTTLALVIKETASSVPLFSWKKSTSVNPFSGYGYTSSNAISWSGISTSYDFFFQAHYDNNFAPTETIVPVGNYDGSEVNWNSGVGSGVTAKNDDYLYLEPKFIISTVFDNSVSMKMSSGFKSGFNNLFTNIFNRTNKPVYGQLSYADLWTFGTSIKHETGNGFTNSGTAITSIISNLKLNGENSNLYDCLEYALIGQQPAAVPTSSINSKQDIDLLANSYIPLTFIVSDADNNTTVSLKSVEDNINYSWNNRGTKLITLAIDEKTHSGNLRQITKNTNGIYFDANDDALWAGINTSLLHGGNNSIFSGYWEKSLEFDNAKFIKSITTAYTVSTGQSVDSSCAVKFKYSNDKKNYSDWISVTSDYTLNKEITNLMFRIDMTEGWNNLTNLPVSPYVSQLYYTEITPAVNYLFTTAQSSSDEIFEYILSTNYSDPKTKLTWGICKGNSTNWNDFEEIISNKNGVIASRQKSFKFYNNLSFEKLTCVKSTNNNYTYFVYNGSNKFTWLLTDTVEVYVNNVLSASNTYTVDNVNGTITFRQEVLSPNVVQVTISRTGDRYESYGEGTITTDYKTFFAINGRWPEDSKVVVLINNSIVRGGYKLDRYEGKIIFDVTLNSSDIVTLFVLSSNLYRVGLKVENYSSTASTSYNFELTKTTRDNESIYSQYLNTQIPYLEANTLKLDSLTSYASVGNTTQIHTDSRIYVDYKYNSDNQQYKPRTRWYRTRTSGGGTTTIELDSTPNYRDRLVQKKADLNAANNYFEVNDQIYVTVEPNDNFDYGISYVSDPVVIKNISAPYVYDVQIKSTNIISENKISTNSTLQAYYNFNGSSDLSKIEWFEWTNGVNNKIAEGSILNPALVLRNMIISFVVTPYDGITYGVPIESQVLYIV